MANRLFYPTGVRPLLVEETARRRRVEARVIEVLESSGFAEVIVPIIDYAEPYAGLEPSADARQTYRFVDREGELISIRSDFTPTVARALAPSLRSSELPLRVFYRGDVIRCEATRLGAGREMFQIGAELIGDPDIEAEVTMMRLAADLLRELGIEPLLVYSDLSLLESLVIAAGTAEENRSAVRTALVSKRSAALDEAGVALPAEVVTLVENLAAGRATLADFASFEATATAAGRLQAIAAALDPRTFVLNLDDFDDSSGYYTGVRFRLFGKDSRVAVARGGRYDTLYERFGTPAPAFGFTITIDDLD